MVVNLFKGLAFCRCGGRMVRESKGPPPKGAVYLRCVKTVHGTCTNTRRWRLDWAEDRLLNSTVRLDLAKVLSTGDDGEPARFTVADMEAKIADLTRALENVLPLVEKGVEVYADRAIALQREINATKAEMAEMKRMALMGEYEPSPSQRRASIHNLRARLQDADEKERAELQVRLAQEVRATVKKVVFGPNRMTATYQGFTMVGKVPKPAEVWVRLFTDDPDDLQDLAEMSFNPDRPEGPDLRVFEFVRRSQAARERLPSSTADEAPHILVGELLPLGL